MTRNLSLDCLRAIAIMTVFTAHSVLSYSGDAWLAPLQFGGTGVDLFFVLSGWLIGSKLFAEQRQYANIDLKRFWLRRWMRTFPAYYAVLILTIVQMYLTKDNPEFPLSYFFFIQNYQTVMPIFYVSWSLCVEEQFYLLIAPVVILLSRVSDHTKLTLLLLVLLLPTVFRALGYYESIEQTHVRWDCCVMGVLLAYLKDNVKSFWSLLKAHSNALALIAVAAYLFCYVSRWNPQWGIGDPSPLGLAIIFGLWVVWADAKPLQLSGFLNTVVMFISTRSYSVYLLHLDALALSKRLIPEQSFIVYYAFSLLVSLIASELLYKSIELPFMNLRKKFRSTCTRSQISSTTRPSRSSAATRSSSTSSM